MNIQPFYTLRENLYSAAAAGTISLSENIRFRKAVEAFEPLCSQIKPFAKLGELCRKLIESPVNTEELIADCIALADALATVQGTFSDSSETAPSEFTATATVQPKLTYHTLNEQINLIHSSSYRYYSDIKNTEIIEIIRDPRCLSSFISDIDSNRPQTVTDAFVNYYKEELVPLIKSSLDINREKGGKHHLELIWAAADETENDYFISLACDEKLSSDIRTAAIDCLGHSKNKEPGKILKQLYLTEKGAVKKAAIYALARLDPPDCDDIWENICSAKKPNEDYITASRNHICTEYIRKEFDSALHDHKNLRDKEKSVRIYSLRNMLANKTGCEDMLLALEKEVFSNLTADSFDGSKLNSILISNINNYSDKEYHLMIKRLYQQSEKFFYAMFCSELMLDPENAFSTLAEPLKKHPDIGLNFISRLKYDYLNNRYNDLNTAFLPDNIIAFLFDSSFAEPLRECEKLKKLPLGNVLAEKKAGGAKELDSLRRSTAMSYNNHCMAITNLLKYCREEDRLRISCKFKEFVSEAAVICPTDEITLNVFRLYPELDKKQLQKLFTKYFLFAADNDIKYGHDSFGFSRWYAIASTLLIDDTELKPLIAQLTNTLKNTPYSNKVAVDRLIGRIIGRIDYYMK